LPLERRADDDAIFAAGRMPLCCCHADAADEATLLDADADFLLPRH